MTISLRYRLAYVPVRIVHGGRTLDLSDVVLDTVSSGTAFSVEALARIGILQEMQDTVSTVHGIGGTESIVLKRVERLVVGDLGVDDIEIEMGALDYGFPMDGILGLDFLTRAKVIVDFDRLELRSSR